MKWFRQLSSRLRFPGPATSDSESGVALFMVLGVVAILAILVTEFTYVSQVNQKMAFDGLDQVKAHYLAKSGLKLSLLRLKAYQNVKQTISKNSGGEGGAAVAQSMIPKGLLEKIWSFPFFFPIPTDVPGISEVDKSKIQEFQKESSLDGRFSALIESESSKFNLNSILAPFAAVPSPSPSPTPGSNPNNSGGNQNANNVNPAATPSPTSTGFDQEKARNSLRAYFENVLNNKFEADPDFATEYRDLKVEDLMNGILVWADRSFEPRGTIPEYFKPKRAPFYTLSELHMVNPIDDPIYELIAPTLTVSATSGVNINTIQEPALRALLPPPMMTKEDVAEFYKFRDDVEEDHLFKSADDFYKYLQNSVPYFRNDEKEIARFKQDLSSRNLQIVTEETDFKITVQATVNQSTRLIEAWVTLGQPSGTSRDKKPQTGAGNAQNPAAGQNPGDPAAAGIETAQTKPDSGLRITFMRIL